MAPKRKKQPQNAFYYFMLDFQAKEERKGRRFPGGLKDVANAGAPVWEAMKERDKDFYRKRAKSGDAHGGEKLTSQGISVSKIEKQIQEEKSAEQSMKKSIEQTIQSCILNNTLATEKFYFVAANYFCKTRENFYVPAEIGLILYTLQDGVINKFHSFINPGNLPLGMTYTAQQHSEQSHKLKIPPNSMGESDFRKLLEEIAKFITDNCRDDTLPPLYTTRENMPAVKSIIQQFCMDADEDETMFRINSLEELFFNLKKAAVKVGHGRDEGFPSIHVAKAAIERDSYEYQLGISCDYHDTLDAGKYCALSIPTRWGFTFSDCICLDLAISLIPGQHVPVGTDTTMPIISYNYNKKEEEDEMDDVSEYTGAPSLHDAVKQEKKYDDDDEEGNEWKVVNWQKKTYKKAHESNKDEDDDDLEENPWAIRSKFQPRAPTEESFSFGSRTNATQPSGSLQQKPRSYGRGRILEND